MKGWRSPSGIIKELYLKELLGEEGYKKHRRNELIEYIVIRIFAGILTLIAAYLVYGN